VNNTAAVLFTVHSKVFFNSECKLGLKERKKERKEKEDDEERSRW